MSFSRDPKGPAGRIPIVVLGARVPSDAPDARGLALGGAIGRRAREAARLYLEIGAPFVVASGGCAWSGIVEADAMLETLVAAGVPRARVVRDRCSLSTRDNARYVARALVKRDQTAAIIVTSAWHVDRAVAMFRREEIEAYPHPVDEPPAPLRTRVWRWGHELIAARLARVM
jgi:uncharacterized SAM-binding protein YcdF (DUF218 family)